MECQVVSSRPHHGNFISCSLHNHSQCQQHKWQLLTLGGIFILPWPITWYKLFLPYTHSWMMQAPKLKLMQYWMRKSTWASSMLQDRILQRSRVTKNSLVQGLIIDEVIGKREWQMCAVSNGLEWAGCLDLIRQYPEKMHPFFLSIVEGNLWSVQSSHQLIHPQPASWKRAYEHLW